MAWRQKGQSDLLRGLNPQGIELGVRKDSQIFPELESPRDMDSDVSGGRGEGRVADVACLSRPCYKRASWAILVTASSSYKALRRYKKYHVNNIGVGVMKVSVQCLHVLPTTR
jgi:hypothetical protein